MWRYSYCTGAARRQRLGALSAMRVAQFCGESVVLLRLDLANHSSSRVLFEKKFLFQTLLAWKKFLLANASAEMYDLNCRISTSRCTSRTGERKGFLHEHGTPEEITVGDYCVRCGCAAGGIVARSSANCNYTYHAASVYRDQRDFRVDAAHTVLRSRSR